MSVNSLILEIGTEEIPAMPLYTATKELAGAAVRALDSVHLAHGEVSTCSTPRRIILSVKELAHESDALSIRAKGPAASIAFDEGGNPTKAAIGFARGKGLDVDALVEEAVANTEMVIVEG